MRLSPCLCPIKNIPILTGTDTAHDCGICQKQFKSKEYLRKHKIEHSEKYKCPRCKEHFSGRRMLECHNKNLEECLKLMKMQSSINVPLAKETEEKSKIVKGNMSESELGKKKTEGMNLNLYQCPECPNQYNRKSSLVKHKAMHTGEFKCPRCEAPFIERSKLDIHTRNPDSCRRLHNIRSSTQFLSVKQKIFHFDLNSKTVTL